MNKVAAYLNEHLAGEVLVDDLLLSKMSVDGSLLMRRPELVVRVANTSDIQKVLRFCSQLASKGHVLPVAARGYGTDPTGGATSRGIILDMAAHMYRVIGVDPKQQLVHLQSGLSHRAAQAVVSTHKGMTLAAISLVDEDGTVGGALSSSAVGYLTQRSGQLDQSVQQMEVVLSNGEIIQTERLSKRELSRKKGLTTFEGEIYRALDNLISDQYETIQRLDSNMPQHAGLAQIARVKRPDGSFDLTPLFIGSQGSLGIISEVILKTQFAPPKITVVAAAFKTMAAAQAAVDLAVTARASSVELYDGRLFRMSSAQGKTFTWAPKACFNGGVVLAVFDAFSHRTQMRAAKKLLKNLRVEAAYIELMALDTASLDWLHGALTFAAHPFESQTTCPAAFSGIWLPSVQLDGFIRALHALEKQYDLALPFFIEATRSLIHLYPHMMLKKVSERQRLMKLSAEVARLVMEHDGSFAGFGGEGRFKAAFVQPALSAAERELYSAVKQIFDPHHILNPDIKTNVPLKELAEELNAWCRLYG